MNKYALFSLLIALSAEHEPMDYEPFNRWLRRCSEQGWLRPEWYDEIAAQSLFFGTAEAALNEMCDYVACVDKQVKETMAQI